MTRDEVIVGPKLSEGMVDIKQHTMKYLFKESEFFFDLSFCFHNQHKKKKKNTWWTRNKNMRSNLTAFLILGPFTARNLGSFRSTYAMQSFCSNALCSNMLLR